MPLDGLRGAEMCTARSSAPRFDEHLTAVLELDAADAADAGVEELMGRDRAAEVFGAETVDRLRDRGAVVGAEDVADDVGESPRARDWRSTSESSLLMWPGSTIRLRRRLRVGARRPRRWALWGRLVRV